MAARALRAAALRWLALGLLGLAASACDAPTPTQVRLDVRSRAEPLRGAYSLAAPVPLPDGRTLDWARVWFWGKRDAAEGEDSWTGTYTVVSGPSSSATLLWGVFTLDDGRIRTGSAVFGDAVLSGDRRTIQLTVDAGGAAVRTTLVLSDPPPS